jgi:GH18 family chitinase
MVVGPTVQRRKAAAQRTTAQRTTAQRTTAQRTTAQRTTAQRTTAPRRPITYTTSWDRATSRRRFGTTHGMIKTIPLTRTR